MVVHFDFTFISLDFDFEIFRYAYFVLLGGCLLFGFYKRLVCQKFFGACHCILVLKLKSVRFLPDFLENKFLVVIHSY